MVNKFTNIKDRVLTIAKKQPMTIEKFFTSIGMTSASFRGKAKDSPLNSNAIVNIITKYPEVDLHWLIMGDAPSNAYKKSDDTSMMLQEDPLSYPSKCTSCDEKLEKIKMLESQIKELQQDKEDFKALLGLRASKS